MGKTDRLLPGLTACIFGLALHGNIATAQSLNIYSIDEPPLNFFEGNSPQGVTSDVVQEILKRTGDTSSIRKMPWARAYAYLQSKANTVLFSVGRTPNREGLFHWVGPIARKRSMLYAKRGRHPAISSLDEARTVNAILTLRQDTQHQLLTDMGFGNLFDVPTWDRAVKMLLLERGDLLTQKDLDAAPILDSIGIGARKIEPRVTITQFHVYIGISKATGTATVETWQNHLDAIKRDGTFAEIIRKWADHYKAPNWTYRDGQLMAVDNKEPKASK